MINQSKREEVIKLLDQLVNEVKIEDLFLFDLSPYYAEKKDDSFFSKQLEFILEKNLLNHSKLNISFTSEQKRIYDHLISFKRIIISAPTSFGKTMLVKEYIYNYQPQNVVFIVPTNSLADELLEDFNNLYNELGYVVYDSIKKNEIIKDKSIFIGTQEKYYNIIELFNKQIDLFVIDEAYKLSDGIKSSREVILNRSFIDTLDIAKKIILLMPLVNEIKGLEQLEFKILKSDYAPVAKNFYPIRNLNTIISEDIQNKEKINLVYFNSPNEVGKFYLKKIKKTNFTTDLDNAWVTRVEEDFHPEWIPIRAIKNGIGVHYGPMPKFMQKKVIELFNNSKINTLLSTNSVIEGVNTPTKNIYITTSRDILGNKNLIKYKNLIGRAGRLGKHKVGNIYYDIKHKEQFEKANIPYEEININFIINNKVESIEINREDEYESSFNTNKDHDFENSKSYLENTNYKNVTPNEISTLLDKYGFTVKEFNKLLSYVENPKIYFLGIIGKIIGGIDITCLNIVLDSRHKTINEMVSKLSADKNNQKKEISNLINLVIEMIYSKLPFKIIPLIDFTISINELYKEFNNVNLLSDKVLEDAIVIKAKFYSKFIGDNGKTEESIVIMTKLFEYGIPYIRVKPYLAKISERVPNNFSIFDIKKIIFDDLSMNDLRIYFK